MKLPTEDAMAATELNAERLRRERQHEGRENRRLWRPYLPENFSPNTVVYTGTCDNTSCRKWYEELLANQRENFCSSTASSSRAPSGTSIP